MRGAFERRDTRDVMTANFDTARRRRGASLEAVYNSNVTQTVGIRRASTLMPRKREPVYGITVCTYISVSRRWKKNDGCAEQAGTQRNREGRGWLGLPVGERKGNTGGRVV